MNYKISTTIDTLKKVWIELKEINLDGLLNGTTLDVNITDLLDKLLLENKLNAVCQIITNTSDNFGDKEVQEVVGLLSAFFSNIAKPFAELKQIAGVQIPSQIE
jgi:hypothetical protein